MKLSCAFSLVLVGAALSLVVNANAQIVINEVVLNQRDYSDTVFTDPSEFVELYNAGNSAVDLSNWVLATRRLTDGVEINVYAIPDGYSISPGDFFVIGAFGGTNVDYSPAFGELFTDNQAQVLEIRDHTATTIDAIAYEIYRTGNTGLANATPAQLAQIGSGHQGRLFSLIDSATPNSWGRYRDGVDTNRNGYDFGYMPPTPGESNNLPLVDKFVVPNVDALAIGSDVTEFRTSFIMPKVIDPTVADGINNKRVLPPSPQGGNAIIAWDPASGGNSIYSSELVNSFDIHAYFDTQPLDIPLSGQQYEISSYGIGTTDSRFSIGNPLGIFTGTGTSTTVTDNSNTGIGWFYQKYQNGATNSSKLLLVDFGDGGNSHPDADEWKIVEEIDVSSLASGWFRLSIDYDPATGDVLARFGDQTYTFETETGLLGTFYVGYREVTGAESSHPSLLNPPVFDIYSPPGDYDRDGDIDPDDYAKWRSTFGDAASPNGAGADGNSDGTINAADYVIWRDHFAPPVLLGSGQTAVPEPASWIAALVASSALAFGQCRRRK